MIELYPDPGVPSDPPTWEDVERLALHYPVAHAAVHMVHRGEWTREHALIMMAYGFAGMCSKMFGEQVALLSEKAFVAPIKQR